MRNNTTYPRLATTLMAASTLFPINLFSQNQLPDIESNTIGTSDTTVYFPFDLDSIPRFNYPTGNSQKEMIEAYIKEHQIWPTQDDGVFTVYLKFVVEKDGRTSNMRIIKGIHPAYDKEAIRLIKAMPKWSPGIKNNMIVRTEIRLPVKWSIFDN